MQKVAEIPFGQGPCAALPYMEKDPEGFILCETAQWDRVNGTEKPVYISATAVRAMSLRLGWDTPERVAELREELAEANTEVERLREDLAAVSAELDAIDGLTKRDFVIRKSPGRKPKSELEKVA